MSDSVGGKRSSPFDRMLDDNRRQFDALLTRRAPTARPAPPTEPLPSTSEAPPPASAPRKAPADGEPFDIGATEIGQTLARRYGRNWRFEIVDRRRDGADVVVWARLTAGDHDKTRRGRARVSGASAPAKLSGSASGVTFTLKTADGLGTQRPAAEDAAYETAVQRALAACAKDL